MLRRHIEQWLPSPDAVRANRSLRWLGPLLARPWLWQLSRRRVATGLAIGVFFAFLVPVAQMLLAAAAAILLRANLPVAIAATLITNPLTFAPIWVAAYQTGAALLGVRDDGRFAELLAGGFEWSTLGARFAEVGTPWLLGLLVFAVVGAALAWVVVNLAWVGAVRRRRSRSAPRGAGGGSG